jgi:hypothetical protein
VSQDGRLADFVAAVQVHVEDLGPMLQNFLQLSIVNVCKSWSVLPWQASRLALFVAKLKNITVTYQKLR